MNYILREFIKTIILLIPEYVANGSPPVISKLLNRECTPIDFGKNFIDGRRILGDGKTIEGFIGGVLSGYSISLIIYSIILAIVPENVIKNLNILILDPVNVLILSTLALLGDLVGAFIKRRLGLARGAPAPILDQLDFLIFPLLYMYYILHIYDLYVYIIAPIFTIFMHLFTNFIAYLMRVKDVPW